MCEPSFELLIPGSQSKKGTAARRKDLLENDNGALRVEKPNNSEDPGGMFNCALRTKARKSHSDIVSNVRGVMGPEPSSCARDRDSCSVLKREESAVLVRDVSQRVP